MQMQKIIWILNFRHKIPINLSEIRIEHKRFNFSLLLGLVTIFSACDQQMTIKLL